MNLVGTPRQPLLGSINAKSQADQSAPQVPGPSRLGIFASVARLCVGHLSVASVASLYCGSALKYGGMAATSSIAAGLALLSNAVGVYNFAVDDNASRPELLKRGAMLVLWSGAVAGGTYLLAYGVEANCHSK